MDSINELKNSFNHITVNPRDSFKNYRNSNSFKEIKVNFIK